MSTATISVNGGRKIDLDDEAAVKKELVDKMSMTFGHNRRRVGGVSADQLRSIISRVEKLEEEKAGLSADIRDIFAEAKGNGFDVKAIRTILKMRKMEPQEREEAETVLDTYLHALGMIEQPDLFDGDDSQPA